MPKHTRSAEVVQPILPTFTFHKGRHSHSTRLAEDGIPEVARRARLGQKMKGIARGLRPRDPAHAPSDPASVRDSLVAPTPCERTKLGEWFRHPHATFRDGQLETAPRAIAIERLKPCPSEEEQGF
ncbi:hypothetical protein [Amycolatopsis speibonae]|uniref:Uncharacterized protein n=1 Tax=Amycolatopsis speibonae TaxID=1450224 RepID=A0ABV7NXW3_9PSEU